MTDLTGAELDAAVATVMDKHPQLLPDVKGVMHCMVPYPQDCAPDAMVAFRPSRGGAAAWEVCLWLVDYCDGDIVEAARLIEAQAYAYTPMDMPTYTCRAVVASQERAGGPIP